VHNWVRIIRVGFFTLYESWTFRESDSWAWSRRSDSDKDSLGPSYRGELWATFVGVKQFSVQYSTVRVNESVLNVQANLREDGDRLCRIRRD